MSFTFYKFQGTGNDFILIHDPDRTFPSHDTQRIQSLCDRRFGIGADGLILLQPHAESDFYMMYFNSDGRESSMCGNGGRCIAAFARFLGTVQQHTTFYAIDGLHQAEIETRSENEWFVKLQMCDVMGVKKLNPNTYELYTGSPHYVQFVSESLTGFPVVEQAKQIRYNEPYTENGINVNFVNPLPDGSIRIRTYERGVEDETLSCGTGATAAAITLCLQNGWESGTYTVPVKVEGGSVSVSYMYDKTLGAFSQVWLNGPAVCVFSGTIH